MLPWQWILMAAVAAALVILGVLVLAAVAASRSRLPRSVQISQMSSAVSSATCQPTYGVCTTIPSVANRFRPVRKVPRAMPN